MSGSDPPPPLDSQAFLDAGFDSALGYSVGTHTSRAPWADTGNQRRREANPTQQERRPERPHLAVDGVLVPEAQHQLAGRRVKPGDDLGVERPAEVGPRGVLVLRQC